MAHPSSLLSMLTLFALVVATQVTPTEPMVEEALIWEEPEALVTTVLPKASHDSRDVAQLDLHYN